MTEAEIRAAHPDWTDDQVTAELERPTPPKPDPPDPKPDDRDGAMARMRREKEAAEREKRELQAEIERRDREQAEQAGEWEKLAKQYETERDQARKDLADLKAQIKVEGIAKRLKFRNTDEAIALLPTDTDRADEAAVSAALEALAENRPHLLDNGAPGPTGLPAGGSPTGLTLEQIKEMSPAEVNRRWDEVQPVLARQSQ